LPAAPFSVCYLREASKHSLQPNCIHVLTRLQLASTWLQADWDTGFLSGSSAREQREKQRLES